MAESALTKELVLELALAARIHLSDEETEEFTKQLRVILNAFKELEEVDTENVEPSYHPMEITYKLREDIPHKWDWDPLANVVDKEKRHIRGPKVK
jgi:aspartyl-tRNA(Asn)/glutamyl-tRNA(Gln) amidotransferase subunit C